jgi:hypothetical protein
MQEPALFSIILHRERIGDLGPTTVGTMVIMLHHRVVVIFPAVKILVAEITRYIIRMGFGWVKIKPSLSEL